MRDVLARRVLGRSTMVLGLVVHAACGDGTSHRDVNRPAADGATRRHDEARDSTRHGSPDSLAPGARTAAATTPGVHGCLDASLQPDATQPRDTATALTAVALRLREKEWSAFRDYQAVLCEGCDVFAGLANDATASSRNMLAQISKDFPRHAWAHCAYGVTLMQLASLGEGEYDDTMLATAERELRAASSLAVTGTVKAAIDSELAVLRAMRGEPKSK